jgi:hypothetical protein
MTDFSKPSCVEFEHLSQEDPKLLVDWIKSGTLEPEHLTFAAEFLGDSDDADLVVPVLLELTKHQSPIVREGAVYGLDKHKNYPGVATRIAEMQNSDSSPGVLCAVNDFIEEP